MTEFKSHYRSLDTKGRLMLPVEYREALEARSPSGSFVLTVYYDRLTAYMPDEWKRISDQLTSIKNPSISLSHFISKVRGLAEELTPDAQGRVRISQPLMRAGSLTKDIVLVGLTHKFEIWDQTRFEALTLENVSDELAAHNVSF